MFFLNVPSNYNFLESIYLYLINTFENNLNLSNVTILLPSRRSANELKRIFLNNSKSTSIILPIMKAIGDVDYDDMLLNNIDINILYSHNELTKPVSNVKYKLLLIKKILDNYKDINIDIAINLSKELNTFLSDVEKNELKLDDLDNLVDEEYALHWQKILFFLKNFGEKWQNFLKENNIISKNTNILKTIEVYTKLFKVNPPKNPIIIVGNFVSIKSTMNLIKTISKYNNTYFIFKGFENTLNTDELKEINELHSHFHFNCIVEELNIKNIKNIKYNICKIVDDNITATINNAMLPSNLTYKWHAIDNVAKLNNVKCVECDEFNDELNIIIFYLLNYIANNGLKNIAIIANVDYAHQIELHLKKWNLPFNNNFGKRFLFNNLVQYLFLILNVYSSNFAPEYLLALLKNNFTYFSYTKNELECKTLLFEKNILDGKTNKNGMTSYKKNVEYMMDGKTELSEFLENIESYFEPFKKDDFNLKELIYLHLNIAEKISDGADLWFSKDYNNKVFEFFQDLVEQSDCIEVINIQDYISLLAYLLSEQSYSEKYSIYPAINIISLQESRLINYDLVIVPNLNDGVFPVNIATDPYMSKSMRLKFGLPIKEVEIGEVCYDFIQLLSQKEVLLSRSSKMNGETTTKSRFLQRLETFLECKKLALDKCKSIVNTYREYADIQYNIINDIYKKRPNPLNQEEKLTRLSATNIETLAKNPYDIYARKILKLYRLNIIRKINAAINIGTITHKIFEIYCKEYEKYRDNIVELVNDVLEKSFVDDKISMELYFDKLVGIINEFIKIDSVARQNNYKILTEEKLDHIIDEENFKIYAIIDRIEILNNNVKIIDYKTGGLPNFNDIIYGEKLQLSIEALILSKNSFNIEDLEYLKIESDKYTVVPNEKQKDKIKIDELLKNTEEFILKLVKFFNSGLNGYVATSRNKEYSDYNILSRVNEWLYE
jgi:ATP-dependent helicase/nuclease subunit B